MTDEEKQQLTELVVTVSNLPDADKERILYIAVGMNIASELRKDKSL